MCRLPAVVIVLAMAGPAAVVAASLPDPTRPTTQGQAGSSVASRERGGPALQSVLISPQRREAIIDGKTVRVGDLVGDSRVVRILETEVFLRAGDEVRALRMFPPLKTGPSAARLEAQSTGQEQ